MLLAPQQLYPQNISFTQPFIKQYFRALSEGAAALTLQVKLGNLIMQSIFDIIIVCLMSAMEEKLLEGQPNLGTRQDTSLYKTEHMDSSQSSIRSGSEMRELVTIFRDFLKAAEKQADATTDAGRLQQYVDLQPRDRPIVVAMPSEESYLSKEGLEKYLTSLCTVVWSKGFHFYSTNQLSFENTKIYCSQQILQNLIKLSEAYNMQPYHFEQINDHLQQNILEYMLSKYPMTSSQHINRNLNNSIREVDNTDLTSNNFLFKSEVRFKFRENGEYNDLIMGTINEAMTRIESKQEGKSVFQRFEDKMTLLFESITNYEWMHNQEPQEYDSHTAINLTLNNLVQKKTTIDENLLKSEYIKLKEREKSSYEEKVRQYTHYKIGKKMPESTRLFTQDEITSHRLKIENPQTLRILTKWCEQLQKKFENTEHFENYIQTNSLEKSTFLNMMMEKVRGKLEGLIKQEKRRIEEELGELASNNYFMQSQLLMRKLQAEEFTQIEKYERIASQFSIDIVNNLHSYIITYLNRLIHGLLSVLKEFREDSEAHQLQLPFSEDIITFQVMDLIRCKCSSKEREIIKLYNQIVKYCDEDSGNMRLVRVVNRLRKGTNDILINVRYRNVLCEIQLAVASNNNTFLQYSNNFNHYLYQLKRSVFGPLTELCGIWKNLDTRFNIYSNLNFNSGSIRKAQRAVHRCANDGQFRAYNKPFICSVCDHHYFHNKFIKRHSKCSECNYWVCARCLIRSSDCSEMLTALTFGSDSLGKNCRKLDSSERIIPKYGICIYVQSQEVVIQPFRKYERKNCTKIVGIINKTLEEIYDVSTEKQASKFRSKFLIFEMDEEYARRHIKITDEAVEQYLITEKYKRMLAKNKDTINLNNCNLTTADLERLCSIGKDQQKSRVKAVQLADNKITSCRAIAETFKHITRLELSKNQVTDFSNLKHLSRLEKVNFNNNILKEFPEDLCEIKTLNEISISQNSLQSIPQSLAHCHKLATLQVASNKLKNIPDFIFHFKDLADFNANSNFIEAVPLSISSARKLCCLSLQNNYIKCIPDQIDRLVELERLNLSHNKIKAIPNLQNLRQLRHLNLRHNKIKAVDQLMQSRMQLKEIDLSYNEITKIDKIDSFSKLKFINISHNQLTTFPQFGKSCENVKHLVISNNKLTKMHASLANLLRLEEIQLSDNLFEEIDPSLTGLGKLLILHMQNNKLKKISGLKFDSLIKLRLKRNKITEVKHLNMKSLEEIDLSDNQITAFDSNFLPKLKKINVSVNNLSKLELTSYHRVSIVQAARNNLKEVPSFYRDNQISYLNLEHNSIQEVPKPMLSSCHLKTLNLSSNQIKLIDPSEIQNFRNSEKRLSIENNPLTNIPALQPFIKKCRVEKAEEKRAKSEKMMDETRSKMQESQEDLLVSVTRPISKF